MEEESESSKDMNDLQLEREIENLIGATPRAEDKVNSRVAQSKNQPINSLLSKLFRSGKLAKINRI